MRISGTDAVNRTQETRVFNKDSQATPAAVENKPVPQPPEQGKKELPVSEKTVADAVDRVNKAISGYSRRLQFSIHEGTKQIMVKVIDSETNEVVREVPPEKILDMLAQMWEMAGILVDERR